MLQESRIFQRHTAFQVLQRQSLDIGMEVILLRIRSGPHCAGWLEISGVLAVDRKLIYVTS